MVSVRILIEGERVEDLETVASALNGIDKKLGGLTERFGIFGEYAKRMDNKLTGHNFLTYRRSETARPEPIKNSSSSGGVEQALRST